MAKQVSLTRRHKTALVDLYLGRSSTDKDTRDALTKAGLLSDGLLTKVGVHKAIELVNTAPKESINGA